MMRVRPDIVKLDRDLIKRIHADPARMALVESFVRFAGRIGATVCAEGIESLDDLAVLSDLDVQWGQGFVLGRPAAPWAPVSPVAAGVCRAALAEALRSGSAGDGKRITAGDRRLEHLSARLAGARSRTDLEGALALIAEELNAEMVCLSHWHPERGNDRNARRERRDRRRSASSWTTTRSRAACCATRRPFRSWSATRRPTGARSS